MTIFQTKAQAMFPDLMANGAPPTLVATPGPFLLFLEQLLQTLLPMLTGLCPVPAAKDAPAAPAPPPTAEQVLATLQAPTEEQKWTLIMTIRNQMTSRQMFRQMGDPVYLTCLQHGKSCTLADAQAFIDQAPLIPS